MYHSVSNKDKVFQQNKRSTEYYSVHRSRMQGSIFGINSFILNMQYIFIFAFKTSEQSTLNTSCHLLQETGQAGAWRGSSRSFFTVCGSLLVDY